MCNDVPAARQNDHRPTSHLVRFIVLTPSKFGCGCPFGFFICPVIVNAYVLPAHLCLHQAPIPAPRAHSSPSDFFVIILSVHPIFSVRISPPRRPSWALVPFKPWFGPEP